MNWLGRAGAVPLWIAIPAVAGLWIASWIAGLDSTGSFDEAFLMWVVTAIATVLLGLRLARSLFQA